MAGQGDTGAAVQSSRPPPRRRTLRRRGRLRLDIGARTRVGGGVRALWFPAPDASVGSDAVADADPAVGAATASRAERFFPSCIYACRNTTPAGGGHPQGDGCGTERAVGHP